jgi:hypothetical protein
MGKTVDPAVEKIAEAALESGAKIALGWRDGHIEGRIEKVNFCAEGAFVTIGGTRVDLNTCDSYLYVILHPID